MPKALCIAGVSSGCGKTAITLGLLKAFTRRGLTVQGFKSGPDFIDPGLHALATGLPSHNLDGWMLPTEALRGIFHRNHDGCDLSIVEGAMGLFDGIGPVSEEGSTAQLAKILDLPVMLVVNARGMARSLGALVQGFASFDRALNLHSVLPNMLGSSAHAALLTEVLQETKIPMAGGLPRRKDLILPARHLGLVTAEELTHREKRLIDLADWLEESLDLDALWESLPECALPPQNDGAARLPEIRIGYARDKAFCFYYDENLRLLRQAGAELVPFSPLEDTTLPPALHGLYLGGGYPELHAETLAANTAMREKILQFCNSGKPVYAECGGFMYLMRSLSTRSGQKFPLVGFFDTSCVMTERHQALGYRQITLTEPSLLGIPGCSARGHEFHYSSLVGTDAAARQIYQVSDRLGRNHASGGFAKGTCLGSYIHLHFASNPDLAAAFVRACTP